MFNYYDNRMKGRLNALNRKTAKNTTTIKEVHNLTQYVMEYFKREEQRKGIKSGSNSSFDQSFSEDEK